MAQNGTAVQSMPHCILVSAVDQTLDSSIGMLTAPRLTRGSQGFAAAQPTVVAKSFRTLGIYGFSSTSSLSVPTLLLYMLINLQ